MVAAKIKPIKVGSIQAEPASKMSGRMAILMWGPSTVGKTTFAATSPGHKLWLAFGDNEHVSVAHRKDVTVLPLYKLGLDELFRHGKSDDPFGLDAVLAENEEIATVVADSLTALTFRALQKSIKDGIGKGRDFTPSIEMPGQSAYGGRNGIVLEIVTGLMRVTAKHNVHVILTAHEADEKTKKDDRGNDIIDYITVMLGGQLMNNMTYKLSEIWHMRLDTKGARRLSVRPFAYRRPMKTRMFVGKQVPDFELVYDADEADSAKGQMTIAGWYDKWVEGGYAKLDIPGGSRK